MALGWLKARKSQEEGALKKATELWLEEDLGRTQVGEDAEKTGRKMHMGTSKISSVPLAPIRKESGRVQHKILHLKSVGTARRAGLG